jgi:hypothetical protein
VAHSHRGRIGSPGTPSIHQLTPAAGGVPDYSCWPVGDAGLVGAVILHQPPCTHTRQSSTSITNNMFITNSMMENESALPATRALSPHDRHRPDFGFLWPCTLQDHSTKAAEGGARPIHHTLLPDTPPAAPCTSAYNSTSQREPSQLNRHPLELGGIASTDNAADPQAPHPHTS